jgi:acyl carrier protein
MFNDIVDILCRYSGVPQEQITPEINVMTDLGLTSMDFMEMICDLEEKYEFEVPECDFRKLVILKDIVAYLDAKNLVA